jgi:hypothetical protein
MSADTLLKNSRRARNDNMASTDLMDSKLLAREALAETLDNLAIGVIIVTDENRILHANRAAVQMFASGRPVRSVSGRLFTRDARSLERLAKAIGLALHRESEIGATGIGVVLGSALSEPAVAHVLPLAQSHLASPLEMQALAAVFIVSSIGRPIVDLAAVAGCLRLTPSEARLV